MGVDIPVLETERLILRGRRLEDFPAFLANWQDAEMIRHITKPLTEEEAWSKFCRMEGFWAHKGYGFWAVEEKASGAFIGEAGVADFKRNLDEAFKSPFECGWNLSGHAQGKGFAFEAMSAALAWADDKFPGQAFSCMIDAVNAPSIRLASKLGFKERGRTEYHGAAVNVYERAA